MHKISRTHFLLYLVAGHVPRVRRSLCLGSMIEGLGKWPAIHNLSNEKQWGRQQKTPCSSSTRKVTPVDSTGATAQWNWPVSRSSADAHASVNRACSPYLVPAHPSYLYLVPHSMSSPPRLTSLLAPGRCWHPWLPPIFNWEFNLYQFWKRSRSSPPSGNSWSRVECRTIHHPRRPGACDTCRAWRNMPWWR